MAQDEVAKESMPDGVHVSPHEASAVQGSDRACVADVAAAGQTVHDVGGGSGPAVPSGPAAARLQALEGTLRGGADSL